MPDTSKKRFVQQLVKLASSVDKPLQGPGPSQDWSVWRSLPDKRFHNVEPRNTSKCSSAWKRWSIRDGPLIQSGTSLERSGFNVVRSLCGQELCIALSSITQSGSTMRMRAKSSIEPRQDQEHVSAWPRTREQTKAVCRLSDRH